SFEIIAATTIAYDEQWKSRLRSAPDFSGEELALLHTEFGRYCGMQVRQFIKHHQWRPALIASHGHTVFHRPEKGLTLQIGSGAEIAAATGIPAVCDFRSTDAALGGQGAPLVPIGDRLLFGDYGICLNLGGFSNASFESAGERLAYDICPVNIALNALAAETGESFDRDGMLAASGTVDDELLERLNGLNFYRQPPPKSLGREWLLREFLPVLNSSEASIADKLATVTEHIARQIGKSLESIPATTLLITGGGAHNQYMVSRIKEHTAHKVIIPGADIVDYKEALVFALLGILRLSGRINCLKSVTGASRDSIGGAVYTG
ncbi:MAG: anhydro-N-acetylmuramic acid kinase, partial [Bacteroidales bacterium]